MYFSSIICNNFYKIQTPKLTHLRPHWTPLISGALLGVLGVIARFSSTLTGRHFGFSTTDGIGEIFGTLVNFIGFNSPFTIQWAGLFIIGLIVGAALSSIQIKEFQLKIPNNYDIISPALKLIIFVLGEYRFIYLKLYINGI